MKASSYYRMENATNGQVEGKHQEEKDEESGLLPHKVPAQVKSNIIKRCVHDPLHRRKVLHSVWIALVFISLVRLTYRAQHSFGEHLLNQLKQIFNLLILHYNRPPPPFTSSSSSSSTSSSSQYYLFHIHSWLCACTCNLLWFFFPSFSFFREQHLDRVGLHFQIYRYLPTLTLRRLHSSSLRRPLDIWQDLPCVESFMTE